MVQCLSGYKRTSSSVQNLARRNSTGMLNAQTFTRKTKSNRYFPTSVPSVSTSGLEPPLICSDDVVVVVSAGWDTNVGVAMLPINCFDSAYFTLDGALVVMVVLNADTQPTEAKHDNKRAAAAYDK